MNSALMEFVEFKKKSDIHIARKVWHMAGVSGMALFYAYAPSSVMQTVLILSWIFIVTLDFMRLSRPKLNALLISIFGKFMRESEINRISGGTYLISGVGIIAFVFPKDIVQISLWFLAFADPLASYFGIRFGREKILGDKSLQGTLAAFFVCAAITAISLAVFEYNLPLGRAILVSVVGGVIGAVAELLPISKLDDNFTLPIMSAAALWCVFAAFGISVL